MIRKLLKAAQSWWVQWFGCIKIGCLYKHCTQ